MGKTWLRLGSAAPPLDPVNLYFCKRSVLLSKRVNFIGFRVNVLVIAGGADIFFG